MMYTSIDNLLLANGSEALILHELGHYEMQPRYGKEGFRRMAWRLLYKYGFETPDQAWETLRHELPGQAAPAVDLPRAQPPDIAHDYEHESLIAALVLGKCCGCHFSPDRPIIWSESRLTRSVRLFDGTPYSLNTRLP